MPQNQRLKQGHKTKKWKWKVTPGHSSRVKATEIRTEPKRMSDQEPALGETEGNCTEGKSIEFLMGPGVCVPLSSPAPLSSRAEKAHWLLG